MNTSSTSAALKATIIYIPYRQATLRLLYVFGSEMGREEAALRSVTCASNTFLM